MTWELYLLLMIAGIMATRKQYNGNDRLGECLVQWILGTNCVWVVAWSAVHLLMIMWEVA